MKFSRKYTKIRIMPALPAEWSIEYYVEESGTVPIREFLLSLDRKTYVRFQWSLEQLRIRNVQAHAPLVRKIEGQIWELREESRTNIFRILYFFFTGRRIILLHGFSKKTDKLPRKELKVAQERLKKFLIQEEGGA